MKRLITLSLIILALVASSVFADDVTLACRTSKTLTITAVDQDGNPTSGAVPYNCTATNGLSIQIQNGQGTQWQIGAGTTPKASVITCADANNAPVGQANVTVVAGPAAAYRMTWQ